jgi:hypothetical protein
MPIATTYNSVGNREHILDYLTRVEPEETPKLSSFAKGPTPKAMLIEYQTDDLDAPSFDGIAEGEDVATFKNQGDGRVMLSSRMQKFRDKWQVSREQELVNTAGVPSEVAYSKAKSLKQLKLSIEAAIGADQEASAGGGGAAYKMRGMVKWLDSTNTNIPAAVRMPAASLGTTSGLTEAGLNTVLTSVYEQSGSRKTYRLFAGPELKSTISGFTRSEGSSRTPVYTVTQGAETNKVTFNVTRYEGDFGTIDIIPDLWLERTSNVKALDVNNRRAGLLIDPSLVSIGYLEQPFQAELDDNGAGRRGYCEAIVTLIVKNPLGLGRFT